MIIMISNDEKVMAINDAWLAENAERIQSLNYTSSEVKIGRLVAANVVKVTPKDTSKPSFDKIQLAVREITGKVYVKDFNIDFIRKYCTQNNIKLSQAEHFPVVFKVGAYKKIGFFAFVAVNKETEEPSSYTSYDDIIESDTDKLEKLGL